MNKMLCWLLPVLFLQPPDWHYNLQEAEQIAKNEHKHILLNFSGSDWCGPCIRLHHEIFESNAFESMADTTLVLVNADFPRKKKNQLSPAQQTINNHLADQYNSEGKFPLTLLLNANGVIIKQWEGFPEEKPEAFCAEIISAIDNDR